MEDLSWIDLGSVQKGILLRAAVEDPAAIETLCQDTAELNGYLSALMVKYPEKDPDRQKATERAMRHPDVKELSRRFCEGMLRARKRIRPLRGENADCDFNPKFEPTTFSDGERGYLMNESAVYSLLATTLTDRAIAFKRWIAEDLHKAVRR